MSGRLNVLAWLPTGVACEALLQDDETRLVCRGGFERANAPAYAVTWKR